MSIKNSLMSITVAALLVGCGGSSSSDVEEVIEEVVAEVVQEKNSTVCLDINVNAICDSGEESEEVTSWEDYAGTITSTSTSTSTSLSRVLDSTNYPLAYNGEDGLILTAAAGSTEITPWTALVNNEIINNPSISSVDAAEALLLTNLGISETPSNDDLSVLADIITTAIESNPNENVASVIAAISEKVIEAGSLSSANISSLTVSSSDISDLGLTRLSTEELFTLNVDANIEALDAAGWEDANDSSIRYLSSRGGNVVAGSIYHNALSVVDVEAQTINFNTFATLSTSGHGTKDETTGASENYLRGVVVSTDGTKVYANVPPKSSTSETKDESTYGLFKANILSDGTIEFSADSTVRASEIFSSFQVSTDETTVIAYNSENYLISYDGNLVEQTAVELENIVAYAISSDNTAIYTAFNDSDNTEMPNYISNITASTLAVSDSKISLNFTPDEILVLSDTKLLAVSKDDLTIAIVDLETNTVTSEVSFDMESNAVSVSPNGEFLAAVGHDDAKILIINLKDSSLPLQHTVELDETSRAIAFVDDETIVYRNGDNSLAFLDLEDTGVVITIQEQFATALEDLSASVNGGYYDAITSDLSLVSIKNGFDVAWTSTVAASALVIDKDTQTGIVTRPANNSSNATGSLTMEVSSEYRGETVTASQSVDIEIRKAALVLNTANSLATSYMQYMATNVDGSIMVAPTRFEIDDENYYGIASFTLDNSGTPVEKTAAKLYQDDEQVAGVGIQGSYAIAVTYSTLDDTNAGRISTIALDETGVLADAETNSIAITTGTPEKVEWNSDQTKAVVFIKESDGTFISEIYDVTAEGTIALNSTIDMGDNVGYKTYGPAVINNAGTKVYQRDGDSVHLVTSAGVMASKVVDNLARVWYGASRVFVLDYSGVIYSYAEDLSDEQVFSTGTGGRMYGGEVRTVGDKNYLYIPVQRSDDELNGIYQLEINSDGTLTEVAFSELSFGINRMAVSDDGTTVYGSYEGDDDIYYIGVVTGINE